MKQAEIYKEREEQNGMKIIPYQLYGSFLSQAKYLMDPIGMIGEQSKK